jgi:hypothetical protein
VRVADSAFESLYETDVLRVERCHLGLTTLATVACTRRDLFVSQVNYPRESRIINDYYNTWRVLVRNYTIVFIP